jgi:uncharacterized protein (DUF697 family)
MRRGVVVAVVDKVCNDTCEVTEALSFSPGAAGMTEPHDQSLSTSASGGNATKERDDEAALLVDRFATWAGCAGFVPVPILDIAAIGVLQLQMLRRLSQMYDVPFSDNRGKAVIASLAGTVLPLTSTIGATSLLKGIPIVGTVMSALAMPALAGGATYAIGRAFIQHFVSGGTLLDFNPPDYKEFIRAQKEMWSGRPKTGHADGGSDAAKNAAAPS